MYKSSIFAKYFRNHRFGERGIIFLSLLMIIFLIATTSACAIPAAAMTVSSGIEPLNKYPPGDQTLTLTHDGVKRTYVVHIPPGLSDTKPVALVLAFHGVGLNAKEMMRISGFSNQSDISGFLVVYPEGTGEVKSWNGGHCCGTAARDNVDDVGFVRTLIGELLKSYPVDPKKVYATGFSNGAILTYRLACELSDLIAAFGPVSATPVEDDLKVCTPNRPVSVMHFHGTADDANPYNGGKSAGGYQFVSVSTIIRYLVDFNACPAKTQSSQSGSIRHDGSAPCKSASAVELYTILDGKHAWPGGEAVNQNMGEPTKEISATPLLWEFFQAHPLP